jgi:hypothetical protein
MASIPAIINGVTVEFASTAVNNVTTQVVDALKQCIKSNLVPPHTLSKIYISSAADSHTAPSRHVQHKAVDISRLNGIKIAVGYPSNPFIKAAVDAIQTAFEAYPHRRENFGPHLKKKLGMPWTVAGHGDHIHLSVN